MPKRSFACRSFACRTFQSRHWAGPVEVGAADGGGPMGGAVRSKAQWEPVGPYRWDALSVPQRAVVYPRTVSLLIGLGRPRVVAEVPARKEEAPSRKRAPRRREPVPTPVVTPVVTPEPEPDPGIAVSVAVVVVHRMVIFQGLPFVRIEEDRYAERRKVEQRLLLGDPQLTVLL